MTSCVYESAASDGHFNGRAMRGDAVGWICSVFETDGELRAVATIDDAGAINKRIRGFDGRCTINRHAADELNHEAAA